MARPRRLTAEETASRLGLSVGRVTEMARQHEIGRKEGGRWTFSEAEIRRVAQERTDRAKVLKLRKRLENDRRQLNGLPPKRKPRKSDHLLTTIWRRSASAGRARSMMCLRCITIRSTSLIGSWPKSGRWSSATNSRSEHPTRQKPSRHHANGVA